MSEQRLPGDRRPESARDREGESARSQPAGETDTDPSGAATDSRPSPVGTLAAAVEGATTVEAWTPRTGGDAGSLRGHLRRDESLAVVDGARLLGDRGGAASVGLSDDRLLAVTDDGLLSVDLDRLSTVRSAVDSTVGLRGRDARLLGAVGYCWAVVAFLGVLATAADPLTPALSLATVGGAFAAAHVHRDGLAPDGRTLTDRLRRFDPAASLAEALLAVERRLVGRAGTDPLGRWGAAALAVVPFAALVALEGSVLPPVFALATVAGFAAVVHAVRNAGEFDGIEAVRRPHRTVVATLDDGTVFRLWTRPDSPLDRELAARVGGRSDRAARGDD